MTAVPGDDDVTILAPDTTLKKRVGAVIGKFLNADAAQKADKTIMEDGTKSFMADAARDVAELYRLMGVIFEGAANKADRAAALKEFQDVTFRIKSRSGTFNYPLASQIAHSLLRYLELAGPEPAHKACKAHAEALRAIFAAGHAGDGGDTGQKILVHLMSLHPVAA